MKIVYVYLSRKIDKYWGMLNISLYSVRKHMPNIDIEIFSDAETIALIRNENASFEVFFNLKLKEIFIPERYNLVEKSRYLKTNLREFASGDFIFVDCDTVFCKDISDLVPQNSISMVLDNHLLLSELDEGGKLIIKNLKLRGLNVNSEQRYYNSGVMIVRDDEIAHEFFKKWYNCWDMSRKPGLAQDQYSLNAVNSEVNIINEISGEWNCQVNSYPCGIKYVHNAIIIHYYNLTVGGNYILNDEELLLNFAKDDRVKYVLDNPKSSFRKCYLYAYDSLEKRIMSTNPYRVLIKLYKQNRKIYCFLDKILSIFHRKKV